MAAESFGEWEIVGRKSHNRFFHLIAIVFQAMLSPPMEPLNRSSVTWTFRNRLTGEIRKINAMSEDEAARILAAVAAVKPIVPKGHPPRLRAGAGPAQTDS
jgi:hypothetical protein